MKDMFCGILYPENIVFDAEKTKKRKTAVDMEYRDIDLTFFRLPQCGRRLRVIAKKKTNNYQGRQQVVIFVVCFHLQGGERL